jgi:hypothetical protein
MEPLWIKRSLPFVGLQRADGPQPEFNENPIDLMCWFSEHFTFHELAVPLRGLLWQKGLYDGGPKSY